MTKKKEPQSALFLWSRRQDLSFASASPRILTARRPSQATVPVSPLLAKNSPPDCFLNAQTFSGSSPCQRKKSRNRLFFLWSRRQDLNLRHLGPKRIYDGTFRGKWLFSPLSARKAALFGTLISTVSECSETVGGLLCGQQQFPQNNTHYTPLEITREAIAFYTVIITLNNP